MKDLVQVAITSPTGQIATDQAAIQRALEGSRYQLNWEETLQNDGVTMIEVSPEDTDALMEQDQITLPSGYVMEIPQP